MEGKGQDSDDYQAKSQRFDSLHVSLLSDQKFTDSENVASHSEVGVAGQDSAVRYGFEARNFIS